MSTGSAFPTRKKAVDREFEDESVFDWLRRQGHADRKPPPAPGITQTAPEKNAPLLAATSARARTTIPSKGIRSVSNSTPTPAVTSSAARYFVLGTDVYDSDTRRVAKFQHAAVARLGADWLNGPDATPEDYEWSESIPTTADTAGRLLQIGRELDVKPSEILPPHWATRSECDPAERTLQHFAEQTIDEFKINMIRDVYSPRIGVLEVSDDAQVSWTVAHGLGIKPDHYGFTIRPDQIDSLITALRTIANTFEQEAAL